MGPELSGRKARRARTSGDVELHVFSALYGRLISDRWLPDQPDRVRPRVRPFDTWDGTFGPVGRDGAGGH